MLQPHFLSAADQDLIICIVLSPLPTLAVADAARTDSGALQLQGDVLFVLLAQDLQVNLLADAAPVQAFVQVTHGPAAGICLSARSLLHGKPAVLRTLQQACALLFCRCSRGTDRRHSAHLMRLPSKPVIMSPMMSRP